MRLRPADEIDLRWFAHEAPAAFGLRCGLGIALERARVGQLFDEQVRCGTDPTDLDRAVGALRRAERVRGRLIILSPLNRTVLFAAYCWDRIRAVRDLDRLGSVALLTRSAQKAHRKAEAKAVAKSRIDPQKAADDGDSAALAQFRAGLLASPLPKHVTLAAWLGPAMANSAELRDRVLAEADHLLGDACQAFYRGRF